MYPNLALPPQPIVTRWGTWIDAAVYYADNFEAVSNFLAELDPTDAISIRRAQVAISNMRLKIDLAFIKANFSCIPKSIKKLENVGLKAADAIKYFKEIRINLETE